ncbi:MAG: MaoC family dehydratase N-terminal domain-containing protein [Myxococcales bacterium]|nr:MaoC family dehydratase N-terminal domain-containing protein [Myxococcales bacterium]
MSESKGWRGNFFEDFAVGQELVCPTPRTITAGDVATYIALTGDRTPTYCGPSGRVHPLVTFHAVFGQTVRQISLNARANLGYADVRWGAPVFVGDTLTTRQVILGLRENSSRETGIVYVRAEGRNQRGETVLSFARWVMIRKSGEAATAFLDAPVIPELPASVSPSSLSVDPEAIAPAAATGGRWRFDDYAVGERIFHLDGMLVNPSDHMSLTRLFQNSAKVHFDGHAMDGRPLVYGGVVISHGYAASFNGLENRVGIAAINAGTHANPTYAGDTLYALTDVVGAEALSDRVGALRLRMVVVKNQDPTRDEFSPDVPDPKRPDRTKLHPSVVLDLDYWDLLSR